MRLENRNAIVTGSGNGIGRAIARRFASEGAKVLLGDVLDEEGERVAAEIGDAALYTRLDVTSEADWQAAAAKAEETATRQAMLEKGRATVKKAPSSTQPPEPALGARLPGRPSAAASVRLLTHGLCARPPVAGRWLQHDRQARGDQWIRNAPF